MPEGLNGRELAKQLKGRKPDLKVIFSSGYSAETIGKNFRDDDTAFLPKPYLPAQLAQLVRQRLDAVILKKSEPEFIESAERETSVQEAPGPEALVSPTR